MKDRKSDTYERRPPSLVKHHNLKQFADSLGIRSEEGRGRYTVYNVYIVKYSTNELYTILLKYQHFFPLR